MDLLVLPNDPAFPIEDAPFVCDNDWDCGTFITFPLRTRQLNIIPNEVQRVFSEFSRPVTYEWRAGAENRESFFQTWLFFGLMAEFLALNEREDGSRTVDPESAKQEMKQLMQDCARNEDAGKMLVGKPFLLLRKKVLDRFLQEGSNTTLRARYMSRCLNLAREMVRYADMDLRDLVRYSVSALGELLVYMLRNICQAAGLNITLEKGIWTTWATRFTSSQAPFWNQMIRAGWCPGDLERFKQEFGSMSAIHYAGRLKLHPSRYTHEACGASGCIAAQIRPSAFELMHAEDGCTCVTSGVDQVEITNILLSGNDTYPVLRFVPGNSSSSVDVVVESRKSDVPFVAISHVWADGLGNPFANALKSCQLLKVAKLVAALQKDIDDGAQTEYRIWLDTLCCPVAAAGKKVALERMANVYREATHVLVLDSALETLMFSRMSGPEKYFRIFATSSWVKRLWTFQEGALNKSLFFRFAEKAVSVSELFKMLRVDDSEDALGTMCRGVHQLFEVLQMRVGKDVYNAATDIPLLSRMLGQLERGIRYRSVSVPSDEALCITTLFGLDSQRVLEFDQHEDRMKVVWDLASKEFGGFPADSIFFMGYDTLSVPGWRWAPRTLLKSGSDATWGLYDRLSGFRSPQMGAIVPQGLEVCFPGWLVDLRPWTPELRINVWEHVTFRPRYPIIARDATSRRLFQVVLPSNGLPKTLPDMSLRHILACPGEFAVVKSTGLPVTRQMLGRIRRNPPNKNTPKETDPLPIEFIAHLMLLDAPDAGQIFFENITYLAKKAASHESSINLSKIYDRDNSINTEASEKVKEYMKQITAQRLEENEEFRQIALRFLDKGETLETVWEAIPVTCAFQVGFQHLPDDQRWIID